jgi:hypothetical protein
MHLFARCSYGSRDAGGILDGYAVPISTLVFVRRLRDERSGGSFSRVHYRPLGRRRMRPTR